MSVGLEILNIVCFTADMTAPLHMFSNVLLIQEKLPLVNQTCHQSAL